MQQILVFQLLHQLHGVVPHLIFLFDPLCDEMWQSMLGILYTIGLEITAFFCQLLLEMCAVFCQLFLWLKNIQSSNG